MAFALSVAKRRKLHILSCQSPTAVSYRHKATRTLKNSLRQAKTPDFIIQTVADILNHNNCSNDSITSLASNHSDFHDEIILAFSQQ